MITDRVTVNLYTLFISKNIIESHGGKIWAENNIDGKGAHVSFTLPLKINFK
jgi:signal transduction histidine kinase